MTLSLTAPEAATDWELMAKRVAAAFGAKGRGARKEFKRYVEWRFQIGARLLKVGKYSSSDWVYVRLCRVPRGEHPNVFMLSETSTYPHGPEEMVSDVHKACVALKWGMVAQAMEERYGAELSNHQRMETLLHFKAECEKRGITHGWEDQC